MEMKSSRKDSRAWAGAGSEEVEWELLRDEIEWKRNLYCIFIQKRETKICKLNFEIRLHLLSSGGLLNALVVA